MVNRVLASPVREDACTSQMIGVIRALPHLELAQCGPLFFLVRATEQSVRIWRSIASFTSVRGGTATGVLHNGHCGTIRSFAAGS